MLIAPVITATLSDGSAFVWPVLDKLHSPPDIHNGIARGVMIARDQGATNIAVSLMDAHTDEVFEPRVTVI